MGIDIIIKRFPKCPMCNVPYDHIAVEAEHDLKSLKDYHFYKPLRARITAVRGSEKLRSIVQLNTYWSACGFVANNIDDADPKFKNWRTKESVDFKLRVACDLRDKTMVAVKPDGQVIFKYLSIALVNMRHIEVTNYFNQAFDLMSHVLKYKDTETFIKAVKSKMVGGG